MPPKTITVVGSLNTDLVTVTRRLPHPGETLTSKSFSTAPGGKGANQAVAACRLSRDSAGAHSDIAVRMVGAVGADGFGSALKATLQRDGVDVDGVVIREDIGTGVAVIIVDEDTAENRILVNPGANSKVTCDSFSQDYFTSSSTTTSLLLMQLETPLQTVLYLLSLADDASIPTVFNPAPAIHIPVNYYPKVTHLIVNETEAALLTGEEVEGLDIEVAASVLLGRGVKGSIIITLGAKGGYFKTSDGEGGWLNPEVLDAKDVVDTTGAGDTFVGAFAVAIVEGKSARAAAEWAGKAAGLKVRKRGAQEGIPWRGEL